FTPQEAMDRLAEEMDITMSRMQQADEASGVYGGCGPRLNEPKDPSEWLGKADGPKAKLDNEKPQGETIAYDELIIDNGCMQLVRDPSRFDIVLMENLYGDIVSDLCAGLVGGLGVVPGANIGDSSAVFEAVHGSAPDIAGKNLANPLALIMSGVMMLNHLGETEAAGRIKGGYDAVLSEGKPAELTRDIGGSGGTREFAEAIIRRM
ncbi:MAG: hypothetical protein HUU16_20040, partial [Candidatus Omnitrophica bacterium]|nr:hypothetical protein [Candidatus Omnitrophota bacterium]